MEVPPPYMAPQKKSKTGLIIGLVIGGILLCCILPVGLLAGGGLFLFNKGKGLISCGIAYEHVRESIKDYAKDHDGKLPNAATWMDDVRPYYKKASSGGESDEADKMIGLMPAEGMWGCDNGEGGHTGMAFNKALSGKKLDAIKDPKETYLIFEVPQSGMNLNQEYKEQSLANSPKMFGNNRGWFKAPIEGELKSGSTTFSGSSTRSFKVKETKTPAKAGD